MISKELQDQLSLLIIRSSMKAKYAILQIAESYNITLMQAMTLCLLEPDQSVSMKSISKFMACDPSSVTTTIEQLVSEGLVERKEADYDRRIKTLTLTKHGLELRDKFLEATTSARLPNLNTLSEKEVEQLLAIIEKAAGSSLTKGLANFTQ